MPLIEGCKHEVEIVVPVDDVNHETQHVVANVQKRAHLPGFRPGKAPVSIIKTRFKDAIRQDVLEHILPKAFRKKADEEHWNVVGTPNVTDIHFDEGEPLRFKAEFEVAPEFDVNGYRGIEAPYAEPQVSEEDVEKRINEIRERKAEYVNEDPRPLVADDHTVVSVESVGGIEGDPIKSEDMALHLGNPETLPEFNEHLVGMSPEEEKEFDVTYPADYGQDRLAGKTVRFKVRVKSVRRKELPELNDEFARDLGDYQNFAELQEAIRKVILSEREYAAQQESKGHIIDALVKSHEFPVPQAYVDFQIENNVRRSVREIMGRDVDPRSLNLDWSKLREQQSERATQDVKASLLLEKVADVESIHATNEEIDRELQRIAKAEREAVAALRMRFEKDGTLGRIASRIRTEKVLNFLFEHSRKVAPVEKPAESTAETPIETPASE
ncbi:MAG TPA: trigger factor [Bryobacteraceae bacterium]|nr:trigger factor [Bryobacteraceae bacterium]